MNRRTKYVILPLLAVVTGFSVYRIFYHPDDSRVLRPSDTVISARDLTDAYDNGEGHADSLFLDKTISVRGIVEKVDRNESGRYVATLIGHYPGKTAVECILDSLYTVDPPDLKSGDRVAIRGKCAGRWIDVVMTQCVVER
ncbi:MAG TPA: hypothetical protein VG605_00190 [Puia sp.]|nr:hypothetical protein [Puia sp.]